MLIIFQVRAQIYNIFWSGIGTLKLFQITILDSKHHPAKKQLLGMRNVKVLRP